PYSLSVQQLHRARQALVRQLNALLLALRAEAVDLEAVASGHEAVTPRHLLLDPYHLRALELDHVMAVQADQVLVDRCLTEEVLVPLEPLSEIVLLHQTAPDEDLHRPVDGGLADSLAGAT